MEENLKKIVTVHNAYSSHKREYQFTLFSRTELSGRSCDKG